jgi:CheY-like chemotaxis protein
MPIGMNLAGIVDWEPGFPFRNLMYGARWWMTRDLDGGGGWNTETIDRIELDADGYPMEIPFRVPGREQGQIVFTILPTTGLPAGRYVLSYMGEGEIVADGNTRIVEKQPGRLVLDMQMRGRDQLEMIRIIRSKRGNHVRNIRIVAESDLGADINAQPFRQAFLDFCAPWKCLRYMDWLLTNNSINVSWAARKRPSFYTMTGHYGDRLGLFGQPMSAAAVRHASGVAIEHCIAASNLTGKDAWLCVPHLADDNYIEQMALLVRETLDPRLKVYVEFSNEIWNWQFQQAQWMLRSRLAANLMKTSRNPEPAWNREPTQWGGEGHLEFAKDGEGTRHPERIGALFRRCFSIWERVFSGAHRSRLVRVCAVQAGWFDTVQRTLRWVQENGGCDALSPAHYFGPDDSVYDRWDAAGASLTAEQVISDMLEVIQKQDSDIARLAATARDYGVQLIAYEAGQHIQSRGQAETPYLPALAAAQKHPLMREAYNRHLAQWKAHGGGLWCAFSSVGEQGTRWGSWGHLEYYGQNPAEMPKFQAILAAATSG